MTDQEWNQFVSLRQEAGLTIDPATAEVKWEYAAALDPYGVDPELPEECQQIGRQYYARSPGSDVWVSFYDLPKETADALWEKLENGAELGQNSQWPSWLSSQAD